MVKEDRLSFKEKICYATGQIGVSLLNQALVLWILFFYSPPKGKGITYVPIGLAGLAITVGRVVDAITDPLVAYISDKTQSRFGRRIPFIAIGSPFLFFVFLLLWKPPSQYLNVGHITNFVYLVIFSSLFWTFYTICAIPYSSLLPEIATKTEERIDLSSFVALAMVVGMVIGFVGSYFLVKKSFIFMGFVFGLISLICFYIVVFTIKERVQVSLEYSQFKIIPALLTTLKNKPYLIYLYSRFSFEFGWNLLAAGMTYMVVVIIGLPKESAGPIMGIVMVSAIASFPVVNILSKKFGKKMMFSLTMLFLSIFLSSIFFIGKLEIPFSLKFQAYILMILMGPPLAGFLVLPNAIISDIIDYDEKITGLRREGMYYGVQGLIIKFGISFAAFIAGLLLSYFGKDVGRDLGIRLLGPTAAFFIFIALIAFQYYPLEEKKENEV